MEKIINNSFVAKSRRKRALINVIVGLLGETIIVLAGIFVPKAIILAYGSETNGIVNSLQQIVTYLVLFEAGLYGSSLVMLYKPMAENDIDKVNQICVSCSRLYKIIGAVYCAGALIISFVYPFIAKQSTYTYFQMFGFSISVFFACIIQSFFGSQYKVVLMASQKNGIVSIVRTISMASYYILLIIFASLKIHPLLAYSLANIAFVMRAFLYVYITRKVLPNISFKKTSKETEKIKFAQTKSCLFQQICATITLNSSAIILSFFAPMTIVSVFTIYNAVLSGIFLVIDQFNQSMITSFGNLNAEQHGKVNVTYREYTAVFSLVCSLLFASLGSLLYPFIVLYSKGITDVQYIETGVIISTIVIGCLWPIRNQQTVVLSAQGKYEQMNVGAVIEVASVVGLSIGGYFLFGLTGLLIGKGLGILIRVIECVYTNNKRENMNSGLFTVKQIVLCEITSVVTMLISLLLFNSSNIFFDNWLIWILDSVIVIVITLIVGLIIRWIFDKYSMNLLRKHFMKIKNKLFPQLLSNELSIPKTIELHNLVIVTKAGNLYEIEPAKWASDRVNIINKKEYRVLTLNPYLFLSGTIRMDSKDYDAQQINNITNFNSLIIQTENTKVVFIHQKDKLDKKEIDFENEENIKITDLIEKTSSLLNPLYIVISGEKPSNIDDYVKKSRALVFYKTKSRKLALKI